MRRLIGLGWLLGGLVISLACGGGGGGGDTSASPTAKGRLQGVVENAVTGCGIAGATVSCDSVTTETNADGAFALNLPYADRVMVGVTAPGYAENHRIAAVTSHDTNNPNTLTVKLLAATTVSFDDLDSSRILTPPSGAAQVSLPANALVTASGAAPTFPVTASLTPIDPTFEPRLMPGDYTTSAGQLMQSYGALDVTFTDNSGRPLNLVQGQSATIRIPISAKYHTEAAPESVPAFWFNTATGKWVEEGTLTLGGEGLDQYYEGTVSHFTTWNADSAADTSTITGYVVRADGSYVAGATVSAGPSTGNDWTSTVTSGSDGSFTIYVKASTSTLINASLGYLNSAAPGVLVTSGASGTTKPLGNTALSTPTRANSILIDGILNLTGTLRDFSPSAPYAYAPVNANRVTNGTFNTPTTPWVAGTGWTIGSNSATCASGNNSIRQTLGALADQGKAGLVSGYKFKVTYTVSRTSGSVTPVLGGTNGATRSASGTYSEEISCGSTNTDIAFLSNNFKGTISNVSVKYFPENMVIDYNTSYPLYTSHPILKYWDGPWWLPDFESSNTYADQMTGLVKVDLGSNNKPVFNGAKGWSSSVDSVIHSGTTFDLWWTDFPSPHGPNDTDPYQKQWPIPLKEVLPATIPKTYQYNSDSQFPIDGLLQGTYVHNNQGSCSSTRGNSSSHNFHYTYELHTTFTYQSGQKFQFTGDDDVWVFINKKLVIDLGCIHGSLNGTITLNATAKDTSGALLNLVPGQSYQFDFFYCERHTTESHMKITTSIPLDSTDIPK